MPFRPLLNLPRALSFVLLPAAPALWKLEGKRVLLFRPGAVC